MWALKEKGTNLYFNGFYSTGAICINNIDSQFLFESFMEADEFNEHAIQDMGDYVAVEINKEEFIF